MIPLVKGAFVCTVHFILLVGKLLRHNGWCNWKQKPELGGYLVLPVCPTQTAPQFYKSNLRFLNILMCRNITAWEAGTSGIIKMWSRTINYHFLFQLWLFLDFVFVLFLLHIKLTAWNSEVIMHFCVAY